MLLLSYFFASILFLMSKKVLLIKSIISPEALLSYNGVSRQSSRFTSLTFQVHEPIPELTLMNARGWANWIESLAKGSSTKGCKPPKIPPETGRRCFHCWFLTQGVTNTNATIKTSSSPSSNKQSMTDGRKTAAICFPLTSLSCLPALSHTHERRPASEFSPSLTF